MRTKTKCLAAAYIAATLYAGGGLIAVETDKQHARTGTDLDLNDKRNMGGIYGVFDYKPTPEERALMVREPK